MKFSALLPLAALAAAAPFETSPSSLARRADCSHPNKGLTTSDCQRILSLGFKDQGSNSYSSNGNIWIGSDGPTTLKFTSSSSNVVLTMWNAANNGAFVNVNAPQITYSLAKGSSVTISIANSVAAGWSAVYSDTKLDNGEISNTWGEITTGTYGTVDVSREVNMSGHQMSIKTSNGCTSEFTASSNVCDFVCNNGQNSCGQAGTYSLMNCNSANNPGAVSGNYNGSPTGGCTGFKSMTVTLGT